MNRTPSRAEALFADALALPAAERGSFLARECGANVDLLAHLVALVAAHEGSDSVLQPPAPSRSEFIEEKAGDAIGRYKLLQKIGEGGCGVVWMAEQEEPVRRRVALKVIKLGMDTKAVVARFEAERQALALMDHPNIAKVLDGGATATGRPFFVMELVRGIPITKYCDENHLTPTARLELFIKVCQAVQHAHQKGIIHRDLKPSNILVTVNDGAPTPKVIDFGIAKATQGRLTDATVFTAFEQFIGTPVYMSPEQAEMSSLDIDTRSDIYSLGVLLYELLTGRPPFDTRKFAQAGVEQIRQHIREIEPPRPSARLRTLTDEEQTTIARLRATAPSQLSVALRGDLDWIVMRCIEKDRTRRYDTANGLAMDVQRYLRHEPVLARPPSVAYLLQKLIRRHRLLLVGTVGAIVAAGVIAVAVVYWSPSSQAHRLVSQARQLIYDSDVGRNEFALAESWLKRAAELAPDSGRVWGATAALNAFTFIRNYDRSNARLVQAQADADKALRLAPGNPDALFGLGLQRRLHGNLETAKQLLELARAGDPQNQHIVMHIAALIPDISERAQFQINAAPAVSPHEELLYNAANNLRALRAWGQCAELNDRVLASKPFWRAYVQRAQIEYHLTGDPAKMAQWLDRIPETKRDEPRVAVMRFRCEMMRRDGLAAARAVGVVAKDYFNDNLFNGPKSYLLAQAIELADRPESAVVQWQIAEHMLRERLRHPPRSTEDQGRFAVVLAALGHHAEMRETAERLSVHRSLGRTRVELAHAYARAGDAMQAIATLRRVLLPAGGYPLLGAHGLMKEPRWDSLRGHPDFPALVRAYAEADGVVVDP